ncbi:MAG: D-alanyl-D-alanine carboxypeptidase/D-alanyl-D-alanine-endopeptidase [Candidatus Pseudobacter hemicellulosilyticus]|uniref:D-alanyl-D-alanine carboxypeptidase/D-alanyl-D-alanine-endopeptidase n=1 Tax=Candidatus Pseudobacter hemicellulosilyticus TaxID=3121375 RepID=A0AAJ5WTR6_9BACT|nr:MAG: D-alanyl-D-alanine carboxypeptidase/D-alanyl-D-alanine-endopeptidase [Pseudobacter sp.]
MKISTGPLIISLLFFVACSPQRLSRQSAGQVSEQSVFQQATDSLLKVPALQQAHVGISIFDPIADSFLFNYQGDKYFVPASNTKIATCYAALKYLGDSLPAIAYAETDSALLLIPSGDPTFLHPAFPNQPLVRFLQNDRRAIYIAGDNWKSEALGNGWSWSDFNDYYMVERSALPVYGNTVKWIQENDTTRKTTGDFAPSPFIYSDPEVDWKVRFNPETGANGFHVQREQSANVFTITQGREAHKEQWVPFITNGLEAALELLPDTIGREVKIADSKVYTHFRNQGVYMLNTLYSQPTDSMLRKMMVESDNFLAEQSLLMVSQQLFQTMDDKKVLDTLLQTNLSDLPQAPHWADGSGLSRYNLFTPQDMVTLLQKLQQDFGIERIKTIFPTGGEGTLRNIFQQEPGVLFAKTGGMTGVQTMSGYLYTRHNKMLLFSVMVNNHTGNAVDIRQELGNFLQLIRNHQ